MNHICWIILVFITISSCKSSSSVEIFNGIKIAAPLKEYEKSKHPSMFSSFQGYDYYTFKTDNGKVFYGGIHSTYQPSGDSIVYRVCIYITQSVEQIPLQVTMMGKENRWAVANLVNNPDEGIATEKGIYEHLKKTIEQQYKSVLNGKQYVDEQQMQEYISFYRPSTAYIIKLDRFVDETIPLNDGLNPSGCITISYVLEQDYMEKHGMIPNDTQKKVQF